MRPARAQSRSKSSRLLVVEGERDRTGVLDPERPRVVERPHRPGVHVREQDADREPLGVRPFGPTLASTTGTSVTTTPGSESSRSLSRNDVRARCREERLPVELLGDDDRDEVGLAPRQPPDLLEHRLRPALLGLEDLEPRLRLREVPPARPDAGVGVRARRVQRPERTAVRDLREYQSAPSVATSSASTQSSTWFVGSPARRDGVDARLQAPARTAGSGG